MKKNFKLPGDQIIALGLFFNSSLSQKLIFLLRDLWIWDQDQELKHDVLGDSEGGRKYYISRAGWSMEH